MRVLCRDAEWLVTRVEAASRRDQVLYCVGADDLTRGHETAFLTQLEQIEPVDPRRTRLVPDASGGYARAKLFLEAQLRQMPLTDPDPHVDGMGAFTPMGYQKEAVQRAIAQLRPRLLLADAVGLGKTIEVGMILSELMKRGQADRILVLAKKSMLAQFQAELWNRFAIPLVRLDSTGLARLQLKIPASKNPFEVYHRLIISIDTLKDIGRYSHFLEDTRWDVVVIDEAHNVAGGGNPEKHLSYRLARRLARRANSMLLTTATPHNGKRETFGRLISLLDPSAIPDPKLREYEASDIKPFFLMRFKEDVRAEAGEHFASREVVPLPRTRVPATPAEERVYRILAELRQRILDRTLVATGIVQWGLYKSFLSSPEACRSTVEKRLRQLRDTDPGSPEAQALQPLHEALAGLTIADSARFRLLVRELESLGWNGTAKSPRLLVFTESRVTQSQLAGALAKHFRLKFSEKPEDQPNQPLAIIHGGMADIHLAATIESFGTGVSPMRLLLATDVASEGVNLHHQCHHIIHYDLPWSIITLIQRNGRIDRFGQRHSPVIRYLMVRTQEGFLDGDEAIFERLVEKVEEINRSTRSGESLLKLYDSDREEEYIATRGILAADREVLDRANPETAESAELESLLLAANAQGHDDWLAFLTGQTEAPANAAQSAPAVIDNSRIRLMSNADFLELGYRTLADAQVGDAFAPLQKTAAQVVLNPPDDLRRRLGAPRSGSGAGSARGSDVIFGATAIPEEAWPEDGHLYLTTDPERVDRAIKAALAQKGQWSPELLLTDQHPVLQWLSERLMMLMQRGEAPLIASPHLEAGELLFCFIGQVSSRAGTPLIVDTHAVSYRKSGKIERRPLKEALAEARFASLANTGRGSRLPDSLLAGFVEGAVEESLRHLRQLKDQRQEQIKPRLDEEERRLKRWFQRRAEHIEGALRDLPPEGKRALQLRRQLDEMERYLRDREDNWKDTHLLASDEPSTRLVLAIEGA
ncbi:DEAD/DEAH box helicase [Thiorhodococcus mannitoliphagus]|uniref:DEAD/DEAH box helicase n=2 Tax=Thiorhodococcus mannitoliphagus TaxID=329406 RepID=A0A6P1DNP8_9GAMM|nr:DEAD/DEAH box helicase [Thiorhodococcus mannitoliphagus]